MAHDRNRFKKDQIPTLRSFLSASGIQYRDGKGAHQLLQIDIPGAGWQALCVNDAGVVTSPTALRKTASEFQRWLKAVNTVPADHAAYKGEKAFKNFHQRLCERFGHEHDPVDWWRDQVSLEEHIDKLMKPAAPVADAFLEDLRDDFAMHALKGLLSNPHLLQPHPETGRAIGPKTPELAARDAYRFADAMLEARKVRP